jgi:hypothetical protein
MLSGYRAFSRHFVKSLPLFGGGFETETELTIKALRRGDKILEVPVSLRQARKQSLDDQAGQRDGMRILKTMLALFRDYKPLTLWRTGAPAGASGPHPRAICRSRVSPDRAGFACIVRRVGERLAPGKRACNYDWPDPSLHRPSVTVIGGAAGPGQRGPGEPAPA